MKYYYVIHTETENIFAEAGFFPTQAFVYKHGGYTLTVGSEKKRGYELFTAVLTSESDTEAYLSVCAEGTGEYYSFNGICDCERVFRQSPHDHTRYQFKMEMSAIPMIAVSSSENTDIFISDNPSFFDNATTQRMIPSENRAYLSSGDPGGAPNFPESDSFAPIFHRVSKDKPHVFRFIALRSDANGLKQIRRDAYKAIEAVWGKGSDSLYRATCFAGNYMHMRKNESGTSDKWIVAGIQYSNTQYFRDSFYQTLIMDEDTEAMCYSAYRERSVQNAENPLMYLIWSYRLAKNGREYDKRLTDIAFGNITACMDKYGGGGYYPNCREQGDFRNWFDICAFEFDDVDAYSQGLCICALECAKRLGYDVGSRKEEAVKRYVSMFNGEYIPMSEKKQYLAVDISVGEVIYHYLFGETFIPDEMFCATYRRICDGPSRTPYGIKVVSAPDGSYLPVEAYGLGGYVHPAFAALDVGRYANGGSYHVYEMLFHIAAYLHGIEDAEKNPTDRLMTDLCFDGATHEYMHTVKGNGVKANQGWNAGIYAIWEDIVNKGKADGKFFDLADEKLENI